MKNNHTKGKWSVSKVPFELRNTDSAAAIYGGTNPEGSCLIADISRSPGDTEADANALLIVKAPDMLQLLESILNQSEIQGREGCTYGDTEYDSISAAYGYNIALEEIKYRISNFLSNANL